MRTVQMLLVFLIVGTALAACEGVTAPAIETNVPSALQTSAAQAPTLLPNAASTIAAAVQAAATQAAPAVETGAAAAQTNVGTAVPAAQTAAAAAQTAIATPPVITLPGAATPAAAGNVVEVKLSEYKIDMPTTLRSGVTTFRVTNAGTVEHSFVVDGQGIKKSLDKNVKPNETATLQVDLTPGTYQIYCPLDNHRNLGMLVNLTVSP